MGTVGEGGPTAAEIRADRFDVVSRWADDLAHEIKNPLHAMVINLELVKRRAAAGEGEQAAERVAVVEDELHRVHALVDSLLRAIRPWPDQRHTDPERLLEQLGPVIRARAQVRRLTWEHEPGAAAVEAAPAVVGPLLLHVLDRAMDRAGRQGALRTRGETDGDRVRLTVEATPAAGADAPPDPSPDDAPAGTAVAAHLAREAGGDLETAPADSGGVRISVTFPRAGSA